jgi:lipopolysaccharide transport system permease protein
MQVKIYTPESALKHPLILFHQMIMDVIRSRDLAWRFFVRTISTQYRQTALGYFWAVFPPIVSSLIFIMLNAQGYLGQENISISYPAFVIIGTVLFMLFVDALNAPLKLVTASRGFLIKINFPKEALLIASILEVLFSFCIKFILIIATLFFFQVPLQLTAILVIFPIIALLMLGFMLGIFLVPIGMLFQDIAFGLGIITNALMLLSPVAFLPPTTGILAWIVSINPLTPLIMAGRDFLVTGFSDYTIPMFVILGITLILVILSWILFRIAMPIIIERLGS